MEPWVVKERNMKTVCRWSVLAQLPKKGKHSFSLDYQLAISNVAYDRWARDDSHEV